MILVTGGAGFVGSHICAVLARQKCDFIIADNLSNSDADMVERLGKIAGKPIRFVQTDIRDPSRLDRIFRQHRIECAIHLAGLKAVGESVQSPLVYYRNNLDCAMTLCEVMAKRGVKKLIFSSSATVYRSDSDMPLDESAALGCTNPYGCSKLMIEQILGDVCASDPEWSVVSLRYFNPAGAHPSGLIGERPRGTPSNLIPCAAQAASGRLQELHVFGGDYPTPDGTAVRDYIHVMDLAEGHSCAIDYVSRHRGFEAINLGTGRGSSVLEMIRTFENASGRPIPYVVESRRPGDIAVSYAKTDKAKALLHWQAQRTIEQICEDAWRWEISQHDRNGRDGS